MGLGLCKTRNKGLESALSELKKETGLSEDEIKDLTNETDVSQVLDQYKSNADKAMVLVYASYLGEIP